MCKVKFKIEGVDTTFIKPGGAKGLLDREAVNRIFKLGKITRHIYQRVENGVLILFCSLKVATAELDLVVRFLKQKVKDQKKKQLFEVKVFQFNH